MEASYPAWLTKTMISGVRGFNLCAYLLALEGWRRGLTLKWYDNPSGLTDLEGIGFNPKGKFFSLSDEYKTHFFFRSRGDKVSKEALEIASNKETTKEYLSRAGVPVCFGATFTMKEDDDAILRKALELDFPLVIKPSLGSLGKGVITNIQTEEELRKGLEYVRKEFDYSDYVMERYVKGDDYRIYVMEDNVLGAIKRVPANVMGDGISSIEQLIANKNEERKQNPHLSTRLIKINTDLINFLGNQGLRLTDVPKKEETVFLRGQNNISSGGDSMDVTKELSGEVRKMATDTITAIPGLGHAGIDFIVNEKEAVVIEVNATAGITLHNFPMFGEPRNIPAGIIDAYFPKTKDYAIGSKMYYDHKATLELLISKSINQIEIANAPVKKLYAKRYVISGKVQAVGYRRWVRKNALKRGLIGYTRNLKNGNVVVIVAGPDKQIVDDFKDLCYEGSDRAEVTKIKEFNWEKQINIGFEIRTDK